MVQHMQQIKTQKSRPGYHASQPSLLIRLLKQSFDGGDPFNKYQNMQKDSGPGSLVYVKYYLFNQSVAYLISQILPSAARWARRTHLAKRGLMVICVYT